MEEVGGDGFLIKSPFRNNSRRYTSEITEALVPALQRRGLVRTEYTRTHLHDTLREFCLTPTGTGGLIGRTPMPDFEREQARPVAHRHRHWLLFRGAASERPYGDRPRSSTGPAHREVDVATVRVFASVQ
jgi:hypothetical protein